MERFSLTDQSLSFDLGGKAAHHTYHMGCLNPYELFLAHPFSLNSSNSNQTGVLF
jgi:hypothetical protein